MAVDVTVAARPGRVRQAVYAQRLKAVGLRQVAVWVPAGREADIHAVAVGLRCLTGITMPGEILLCEKQLTLPGLEESMDCPAP